MGSEDGKAVESSQRELNSRVTREGIELWRKQKEFEHRKKLKEQQEMRDMLERYWPWSNGTTKPRGYKNLRLEELFPNKDYEKSKRFVGVIDWGKPGGGAPMRNAIRTREDPMLRFQYSKDLRRAVDNNLRYKTNKMDQQIYKKQLDELVEEKKQRTKDEKLVSDEAIRKQFLKTPPWGKKGPGGRNWRHPNAVGLNFLKSLGWSTQHTLAALEEKSTRYKDEVQKNYENFKKIDLLPPNKVIRMDNCVSFKKDVYPMRRNRKLSPLSDKRDNGVELVTLLAKERRCPHKIPLATTDITSEKKLGRDTIWNREGSAYLKQLTNQMLIKEQTLKEIRAEERDNVQRHFSTWDSFWGRPGHGAPLPEIKKQCLDQLLYPKFFPVSVH